MKILFISLGCDKNLADSEEMLGLLTGNGHEIVDSEEEADAIVINTCCFIHDAKEEREKRFQMLADRYDKEQAELTEKIEQYEREGRAEHDQLDKIQDFIEAESGLYC